MAQQVKSGWCRQCGCAEWRDSSHPEQGGIVRECIMRLRRVCAELTLMKSLVVGCA